MRALQKIQIGHTRRLDQQKIQTGSLTSEIAQRRLGHPHGELKTLSLWIVCYGARADLGALSVTHSLIELTFFQMHLRYFCATVRECPKLLAVTTEWRRNDLHSLI